MSEESIASGSGIHRERPNPAEIGLVYNDAVLMQFLENEDTEEILEAFKGNKDILFRICALCMQHDSLERARKFIPDFYDDLPPFVYASLASALRKHQGDEDMQKQIIDDVMQNLFSSPVKILAHMEFYTFLIQTEQFDLLKIMQAHDQNEVEILVACPPNDLKKLLEFGVLDRESKLSRLLNFVLEWPSQDIDDALLKDQDDLCILTLLSARLQKEKLLEILMLRAHQENAHLIHTDFPPLLLIHGQDISLEMIAGNYNVDADLGYYTYLRDRLAEYLFWDDRQNEGNIKFLLRTYKDDAEKFKDLAYTFFCEFINHKAQNLGLHFARILLCLAELGPEEKNTLFQAFKNISHYLALIEGVLESCYHTHRMDVFAQVYRAYPEEQEIFYQAIQRFFCVRWSAEIPQLLRDNGIDVDDYLNWQREHLRLNGLLPMALQNVQRAVVLRDITQLEELLRDCEQVSVLCQNARCFAALYAWEEGLALLRSRGLINANELHQLLRQLHEQGYHTRGQATLESTDIKLIDLELKFLKNSTPSMSPGHSFEKILWNHYFEGVAYADSLFRQPILAYILKGGKYSSEVLSKNIYIFTPFLYTPKAIPLLIYWFRDNLKMVIKMLQTCRISASRAENVLSAVSQHLGTPLASTYEEAIQDLQIRSGLLAEEDLILSTYDTLIEAANPDSPEARPLPALLLNEVVYQHALLLRRRYTAGLYQPAEGVDENIGSRTSHKLLGAPSS